MSYIIHNGDFIAAGDASVPVDDRGLLLGDGLFETMRTYNARVFRMGDHLERLFRSCRDLNFELTWSEAELAGMVDGLVEKNGLESARVRLTLTRGKHQGSMGLSSTSSPTLIITAEQIPASLDDGTIKGIKLVTPKIRFSENNPVFRHKTLNRLPNMIARAEAENQNADEAIVLDERGNVATCSTGNIFTVQYGQLFTPPLTGPVLPGITRKVVIELARKDGVPVREDFFSPIIFAGADEAFLTNSVQEIVSVLEVDGRPLSDARPGPLASRLLELYRESTQE